MASFECTNSYKRKEEGGGGSYLPNCQRLAEGDKTKRSWKCMKLGATAGEFPGYIQCIHSTTTYVITSEGVKTIMKYF